MRPPGMRHPAEILRTRDSKANQASRTSATAATGSSMIRISTLCPRRALACFGSQVFPNAFEEVRIHKSSMRKGLMADGYAAVPKREGLRALPKGYRRLDVARFSLRFPESGRPSPERITGKGTGDSTYHRSRGQRECSSHDARALRGGYGLDRRVLSNLSGRGVRAAMPGNGGGFMPQTTFSDHRGNNEILGVRSSVRNRPD